MASAHTVSDSDSDKTMEPDSDDTLDPSTRDLYNNSPDLFDNPLPSIPMKKRIPSITRQRGKVHEISESDSDDLDQCASQILGKSLKKTLDTTSSNRIKPLDTSSNRTKLVDTSSNRTKKIDTTSNRTKPLDTTSNRTKPLDITSSNRTKPLDTTSNRTKPLDITSSNRTKPLDTASNRTKPLDITSSNRTKPLDTASNRTKPLDITSSNRTKPLDITSSNRTKPLDTASNRTKPLDTAFSNRTKQLDTTSSSMTKSLDTTSSNRTKPLDTTSSNRTKPIDTTSSSMTKSLDTNFSKRQELNEKTKHKNMTVVQSDQTQKNGRSSSAFKNERDKSTSIGQQMGSRLDKSSGDTGSKDDSRALSKTNEADSTKLGLKRKVSDSKKESQTTLQKHETNDSTPQDSRPLCKYDAMCYRKNPSHFQEYRHPEKDKSLTSSATEPPPPKKLKQESEVMAVSSHTQPTTSRFHVVTKVYELAQPFSFFLTKVAGIADKYNSTLALDIKDILSADMGNLVASCQFNYMFDIPWLVQQYPKEFRSKPLLIVHGEQGPSKTTLEAEAIDYSNVRFCQAKLEMLFGTHHTKMMLLQYDTGMRVVIHTSNLIKQDWHQKTQGIWISPLFPKMAKPSATEGDSTTHFKRNLLEYLSAYKAYQLKDWINNISEHDMSTARVVIIGSVPGRHTGDQMKSWGHMKLKRVLQQHGPSNGVVKNWPVIGQFSSIGSMGANKEAWLCGEWLQSLSAATGGTTLSSVPLLKLVFPTKDNVRCSLEGFPAGGSIPYSINVAKKQMFLHDFFHQWRSEGQGRSRAMPHIKTYLRPSPDNQKTAWFLVTSANLSKAAWGALEKKGTQLMIRSYEIGVLFLPKFFGGKDLFDVSSNFEMLKSSTDVFPLPFDLPLTDYIKGKDRPWMWDIPYMDLPDTNGNIWCPGAR
ncbi:hypothetical protein ACJMK2_036432 [Sinanodonta woodiana]|uniref:PBZ-type domain-containing protein n=1 Tax=Sinanodonta woodiana TaxID=1069815 RepID=A0ABD3WIZ5_SINWO